MYTALITDNKGCTLSETANIVSTGIVHVGDSLAVIVYPNPFSDQINLEYSGSGNSVLFIYNGIGEEVGSGKSEVLSTGRFCQRIDMSSMPAGVYLISIVVGDQKIFRKIIKE